MQNDLEERLLAAKIAKKIAETESLKRPFSKPSNWLPIFVAAGSIFTAVAQYQSFSVERERAALEAERKVFEARKELEIKSKELNTAKKQITEFGSTLASTKEELSKTKEKRQHAVSELEDLEKRLNRLRELSIKVDSLNSSVAKAIVDHADGTISEEGLKTLLTELALGFEKATVEFRGESASTLGKIGTLKSLIAECRDQGLNLPSQIAYVLATVEWETAKKFEPLREAFWLSENWRKSNLRYYPYYGRGYIKLTWKNNYKKYGKMLNIDLVNEPDLALRPEVARFVTVNIFVSGSGTGKKLSDYINEDQTDYLNARRTVNGLDKAHQIAAIAKRYEKEIRSGKYN